MNVPAYVKQEPTNKADWHSTLLKKSFALGARDWVLRSRLPPASGNGALGRSPKVVADGKIYARTIGHHHLSQLWQPGGNEAVRGRSCAGSTVPSSARNTWRGPTGSTFDPSPGLPEGTENRRDQLGFCGWQDADDLSVGFVDKTYTAEPQVWFHDIFRADGTPFDANEVAYIKMVTGKSATVVK